MESIANPWDGRRESQKDTNIINIVTSRQIIMKPKSRVPPRGDSSTMSICRRVKPFGGVNLKLVPAAHPLLSFELQGVLS